MANNQTEHPCRGKSCDMCESCIFDMDIFSSENNINVKDMSERKVCNGCEKLRYCGNYSSIPNRFDVACSGVSYEAFNEKRPRRIDYNVTRMQTIVAPSWCPLKEDKTHLPSVINDSTAQETSSKTNTASNPSYTSYADRREKMKGLRKHLDWDEIKEGNVYVIPKILSQSRKILKVITKTDMSCICHEINEFSGNEYSFNTTVYPSDLDAIFITKYHKF